MKSKRTWSLILAAALTLSALPALAKTNYVTIEELYLQTREGWHGAYQSAVKAGGMKKGDAFRIDLEIEVPDVEKCPMVELQVNTDLYLDEDVSMRESARAGTGLLEVDTMYNRKTDEGFSLNDEVYSWCPDGQGKNSPLTMGDATDIMMVLAEKYFKVDNLVVLGNQAFGGTVTTDNPYLVQFYNDLDYGWYWLSAVQQFEGIPVLFSGENTRSWFPTSCVWAEIYKDGLYSISGATLKQVGMRHEDLPLLPWSEIQKSIEKLIKSGKIINVYQVRFGYQLVLMEKGTSNHVGWLGDRKSYPEGTFDRVYQVRPVWRLLAYEVGTFDKEEIAGEPSARKGMRPSTAMAIDAQTGEVVYSPEAGQVSNSIEPKILTWKDVK